MTTDTMRAAVGAIHQQIMNLPDGVVKARHSEFLQGFQEGHKAARHAAAEMVSSALSLLRAALPDDDDAGDLSWEHRERVIAEGKAKLAALEEGGEPSLTDEQCDKAAAQAMDRIAAAKGMHALDLNPDITAHWTLRRELVRAGYALAASTAAPKEEPTPVAHMVAIDDGLGTVFLEFFGERPPAGTKLYTRPIAADTQGDAK